MKKIIGSLLLLSLIGIAFYQALNQPDAPAEAVEGNKAIDFTLRDLEGKEISLADYKGKKVLLNFWATWCKPCKKEMPDMEKLHKANPDIVVLAVNIDTENKVKEFMNNLELTFPTVLDVKGDVNKNYKVVSIPTSFFIDEKGMIKKKVVGTMEYDQMQKNMEKP